MARYQIVDERTEQKQIQGRVYAESDDDQDLMARFPALREQHPQAQLVLIDTWRDRLPIA